MEHSLGTRLRQHRERRGLSLADIAAQTKIKMSLLDGLERDDVSQWPAGIFRRAYIRTYAAAIGFDADTAAREFLQQHPEPVDPVAVTPPAPRGLRGVLGSALGSFLRQPSVESTSGQIPAGEGLAAAPEPGTLGLRPRPSDVRPQLPDLPAREPEPGPMNPDFELHLPDLEPRTPANTSGAAGPDLMAAAAVCTELGRVDDADRLPELMREVATVLGARGLIVWLWDSAGEELRPAIVHGYAANVRSRLRGVRADADNITAAAFRSSATHTAGGALAVPILAPAGHIGVLALELTGGGEAAAHVRALATVFAAMLAQLAGGASAGIDAVDVSPRLEAHSG
jgi:transcriptional regulator with XRE-family HTH domain